MLTKVISGGQTGADRAGLIAAKAAGYATGGCMPLKFKAQDGYHPEFADLYSVTEHASSHYAPRTFKNVRDSDGTVRFAINFQSAGELLTLNAIKQYKKVWFDVHVVGDTQPHELAK